MAGKKIKQILNSPFKSNDLRTSIMELELNEDSNKEIMTERDFKSNKEFLIKGNIFENNASLENLENEIKKVEKGIFYIKHKEMKFNCKYQNEIEINTTIKVNKNEIITLSNSESNS